MRKLLILALALMTITACPVTTPAQPKVTRVEITGGAGLFTSLGQTSVLKATAYDQDNKVMDSSFSWLSSNPSEISVSASGEAKALVDLGSSAVTAEAAGVKSAPVILVAAKPNDGAVLLSDTQMTLHRRMRCLTRTYISAAGDTVQGLDEFERDVGASGGERDRISTAASKSDSPSTWFSTTSPHTKLRPCSAGSFAIPALCCTSPLPMPLG